MISQVEPNISNEDVQNVTEYMSSGSWITEHKVQSLSPLEINPPIIATLPCPGSPKSPIS